MNTAKRFQKTINNRKTVWRAASPDAKQLFPPSSLQQKHPERLFIDCSKAIRSHGECSTLNLKAHSTGSKLGCLLTKCQKMCRNGTTMPPDLEQTDDFECGEKREKRKPSEEERRRGSRMTLEASVSLVSGCLRWQNAFRVSPQSKRRPLISVNV
jgi:hypothetical protein